MNMPGEVVPGLYVSDASQNEMNPPKYVADSDKPIAPANNKPPNDNQEGSTGDAEEDNNKSHNDDVEESTDVAEEDNCDDEDDDVDKGYFGIVTYYVQMAAVITIQIEFSDIDKSESFLDQMVENIGIFLNIELTQMSYDVCPVVGLTTTGKHLYNLAFLFMIYLSWAGFFILTLISLKLMTRKGKTWMLEKLNSLQMRLIGGLVEIIKYTYAGFCGIIFMSLICSKVGKQWVWWYDATNVCLEHWQIFIVLFAAFYAIPLPFILLWGMKLLKDNDLSAWMFLVCCLCPPIALYPMWIKQKCVKHEGKITLSSRSEVSDTIISFLQGPYREDVKHMTLYWEAMVSIRRLLITAMTLVGYASIRMIIITGLSIIFLCQHIILMPFHVITSNYVEMLSLGLLCIASVINLLKASLTDSAVVPSGPTVPFFKALEFSEKMFVLVIIAFILLTEFKLRKNTKSKQSVK